MLFGLSARTQTLEVPRVAVAKGSPNIPRIEKPMYPSMGLHLPDGLNIEPSRVVLGTASKSAQRAATRQSRPVEDPNRRLVCVVASGVKALSEGAVAIVRFEADRNARRVKIEVQVVAVVGVFAL